MTCCSGVTITTKRNGDLRVTYTFPAGYNLGGVSAIRMQVKRYEGDTNPALISVTMTTNGYGSVITIVGSTIILTVDHTELNSITPEAVPTDPNALAYDIVLTFTDGFDQYFLGGPFILYPTVVS